MHETYHLHARFKGLIRCYLKSHGAGPCEETDLQPSSKSLQEEEATGFPFPWYNPNAPWRGRKMLWRWVRGDIAL